MASIGGAGCAKRTPGFTESSDGAVRQYGQDCVVSFDLVGDVPGSHIVVTGVLDGHGLTGGSISRVTAEYVVHYMKTPENNRQLVEAVQRRSRDDIDAFCKKMYEELESLVIDGEAVYTSTGINAGGSTCTLNMVVAVDGRLVVVSPNVGDSPAGLIKEGVWVSMSTDHSPENPEEYGRYRASCLKRGIEPADAVYGRINCSGFRMPDADGNYEPIHIYKNLDPDQPDGVIINERNAVHMQTRGCVPEKSLGGSQTVRRMVYEETCSDGWQIGGVIPEYYGQNWGSTLDGTLQVTRSIKDTLIKNQFGISAEPSVAIYELAEGEECTLIAASDGFTDVFYFNEIVIGLETILRDDPQATGSVVASAMLDQCMARAKLYPTMFPVYPKMTRNDQIDTPGWDDVSIAVCRLRN